MAVALAPVVPLVGGMMGSKNQVVIDESTVEPQLRELLPIATKLAFMNTEPDAIYAAEHMELNSDYQVSLVSPPEATSPSQAKRYMAEVCTGEEKPHLVFYFQSPNSDIGTGTTVKGVLTGRVAYNIDVVTHVIRCRTGWRSQFLARAELNQGMYNADKIKLSQELGQLFSEAVLRLAGKLPPLEGSG